MALTKAQVREILSAAGVDKEHMNEAVDKIIDGHVTSINALREDVETYKADAEKLAGVQKELDALKAADVDGLRKKYDALEKKYDSLQRETDAKAARAAKEAAARAWLESKGVKDGNLTIALRGMGAEIDALALEDGKIKDASALEALIQGDFKGLVTTVTEKGAPPPATPPKNISGKMTREQIYARDAKGHYILSTEERQNAIAENLENF